MEDLVEAERARPRVRPLARVDDGAGRVEDAAGGEERHRHGVELAHELRRGDEREPPEHDVAARDDGPRRVDPAEAEHDAGDRPRPGADEQHPRDGTVDDDERDRRVARRDEDEDRAVVDAAQQRLEAPRAGPAVIQRRAAEQRDEADAVDGDRDVGAGAVRQHEQHDRRGDREQERRRVRDAAQARDELAGFVEVHLSEDRRGLSAGRACAVARRRGAIAWSNCIFEGVRERGCGVWPGPAGVVDEASDMRAMSNPRGPGRDAATEPTDARQSRSSPATA